MTDIDARALAGLRRQLEAWRTTLDSGAARAGWKIGFNTAKAQELMGLDAPVIGYLTSATELQPGATSAAAGTIDLRGAAEIAVRIGSGGGIDGYAAALELVDVGNPPEGLEA